MPEIKNGRAYREAKAWGALAKANRQAGRMANHAKFSALSELAYNLALIAG